MKTFSVKSINNQLANETGNVNLPVENPINKTDEYAENLASSIKFLSVKGNENFWEYIKSNDQNITGDWNFTKGIKVQKSLGDYTYTAQLLEGLLSLQVNSIYGLIRTQYEMGLIRFISNGFSTTLQPISPTKYNYILLPDKSGVVALTNDFIITPVGTADNPPIIIPNGILTTILQNGAIERDESGQLWETHNNVRSRLLSTANIGVVNNSTTTTLSSATLNSTYPEALIGFRVHCLLISTGSLIYEKTNTGWVQYASTVVE
ncbi:hypothetical protein [Flavobacterium denitrificans]|uniref:hypothetical protein n=1 Tax=Flavobacterium denitrificans TaxID=281361 RepID=UPI0003F9248B|nr:hypothetical protein [Flavobacterium denitrificans]